MVYAAGGQQVLALLGLGSLLNYSNVSNYSNFEPDSDVEGQNPPRLRGRSTSMVSLGASGTICCCKLGKCPSVSREDPHIQTVVIPAFPPGTNSSEIKEATGGKSLTDFCCAMKRYKVHRTCWSTPKSSLRSYTTALHTLSMGFGSPYVLSKYNKDTCEIAQRNPMMPLLRRDAVRCPPKGELNCSTILGAPQHHKPLICRTAKATLDMLGTHPKNYLDIAQPLAIAGASAKLAGETLEAIGPLAILGGFTGATVNILKLIKGVCYDERGWAFLGTCAAQVSHLSIVFAVTALSLTFTGVGVPISALLLGISGLITRRLGPIFCTHFTELRQTKSTAVAFRRAMGKTMGTLVLQSYQILRLVKTKGAEWIGTLKTKFGRQVRNIKCLSIANVEEWVSKMADCPPICLMRKAKRAVQRFFGMMFGLLKNLGTVMKKLLDAILVEEKRSQEETMCCTIEMIEDSDRSMQAEAQHYQESDPDTHEAEHEVEDTVEKSDEELVDDFESEDFSEEDFIEERDINVANINSVEIQQIADTEEMGYERDTCGRPVIGDSNIDALRNDEPEHQISTRGGEICCCRKGTCDMGAKDKGRNIHIPPRPVGNNTLLFESERYCCKKKHWRWYRGCPYAATHDSKSIPLESFGNPLLLSRFNRHTCEPVPIMPGRTLTRQNAVACPAKGTYDCSVTGSKPMICRAAKATLEVLGTSPKPFLDVAQPAGIAKASMGIAEATGNFSSTLLEVLGPLAIVGGFTGATVNILKLIKGVCYSESAWGFLGSCSASVSTVSVVFAVTALSLTFTGVGTPVSALLLGLSSFITRRLGPIFCGHFSRLKADGNDTGAAVRKAMGRTMGTLVLESYKIFSFVKRKGQEWVRKLEMPKFSDKIDRIKCVNLDDVKAWVNKMQGFSPIRLMRQAKLAAKRVFVLMWRLMRNFGKVMGKLVDQVLNDEYKGDMQKICCAMEKAKELQTATESQELAEEYAPTDPITEQAEEEVKAEIQKDDEVLVEETQAFREEEVASTPFIQEADIDTANIDSVEVQAIEGVEDQGGRCGKRLVPIGEPNIELVSEEADGIDSGIDEVSDSHDSDVREKISDSHVRDVREEDFDPYLFPSQSDVQRVSKSQSDVQRDSEAEKL